MLCAKRHELKSMFNKHYSVYKVSKDNSNQSHRLLLFYAIECGVKVLLLKYINGNTTNDLFNNHRLKDHLSTNGHDIDYMLKFIGQGYFRLPNLRCKNGVPANCSVYNQVWRYGIEVERDKERVAEEELCKIAEWLERMI